jgi:branched-chain amino acid transport system substrate-binding protein
MRKWILPSAIVAMALASAGAAHAFMDEGTVRVGHIGILTGPGVDYGTQVLNGLKVAQDEINQAGGVTVAGKKVKFDLAPYVYDSARNVAQAIALTRKLALSDKVLAVFGPVSSNEAVSVFGVLQRKLGDSVDTGLQLPIMNTSAMRDGLGEMSPWAFRNATVEQFLLAESLPKVIAARGPIKTASVVYLGSEDYGPAMLKNVYGPLLEKQGIQVVSADGVHEGDRDYSALIGKLMRLNPDMLILLARYDVGAKTMIEAKRQGFTPKLVWASGMISQELIKTGRAAVEGMMMVSSYDATVPRAAEVAKKFKVAAGVEMNEFGANSYEALYLLKAAIESSDLRNTAESVEEDRRKLQAALRQIKGFPGLIGNIDMHPSVNDTIKQGLVVTIRNGQFDVWKP